MYDGGVYFQKVKGSTNCPVNGVLDIEKTFTISALILEEDLGKRGQKSLRPLCGIKLTLGGTILFFRSPTYKEQGSIL